jgi:hypothetical protein
MLQWLGLGEHASEMFSRKQLLQEDYLAVNAETSDRSRRCVERRIRATVDTETATCPAQQIS